MTKLGQARDTKTSPADLSWLSTDQDWSVRYYVAKHPNTPPLVKVWLQGGYGEMSLPEFLEAAQ